MRHSLLHWAWDIAFLDMDIHFQFFILRLTWYLTIAPYWAFSIYLWIWIRPPLFLSVLNPMYAYSSINIFGTPLYFHILLNNFCSICSAWVCYEFWILYKLIHSLSQRLYNFSFIWICSQSVSFSCCFCIKTFLLLV